MTKNTSSIDSLIEKLHTYCKFAGAGNVPDGLRDFILSPVPREHGLGVVRGIAKEVDTWVRELLSPAQQDEIVRHMRAAGVHESDLPATQRTRSIRRFLKISRQPRPDEAELIRQAVEDWRSLSLSAVEVESIRALSSDWKSGEARIASKRVR